MAQQSVSERQARFTIEYWTAGALAAGRHEAEIVVATNLHAQPEMVVPLTVVVRPSVTVEPARLFFYQAPAGAPTVQRVIVRAAAGGALRVRSVECDHPFVTVSSVMHKPDGSYELAIEVVPPGPGFHPADVTVHTDREREEHLLVPVAVDAIE